MLDIFYKHILLAVTSSVETSSSWWQHHTVLYPFQAHDTHYGGASGGLSFFWRYRSCDGFILLTALLWLPRAAGSGCPLQWNLLKIRRLSDSIIHLVSSPQLTAVFWSFYQLRLSLSEIDCFWQHRTCIGIYFRYHCSRDHIAPAHTRLMLVPSHCSRTFLRLIAMPSSCIWRKPSSICYRCRSSVFKEKIMS